MNIPNSKAETPSVVFLTLGLLLVAIASVSVSFYFSNSVNTDELIGFIARYLAPALLGCWILSKEPRFGQPAGKVFLAGLIYAGAAVFEYTGEGFISRERYSYKENQAIVEKFPLLLENIYSGNRSDEKLFEGIPNELGQLFRTIEKKALILKNKKDRFSDFIEKNALLEIISPQSLVNASIEEPLVLKVAETHLIEIRKALEDYYTSVTEQIESSNIPENFRDSMLDGFIKSRNESYPLHESEIEVTLEILQTLKKLYHLAAISDIAYDSSTDEIIMRSEKSISEYNRLMDRLAKLWKKAEVIESNIIQSRQALLTNSSSQ